MHCVLWKSIHVLDDGVISWQFKCEKSSVNKYKTGSLKNTLIGSHILIGCQTRDRERTKHSALVMNTYIIWHGSHTN